MANKKNQIPRKSKRIIGVTVGVLRNFSLPDCFQFSKKLEKWAKIMAKVAKNSLY